jgi:hypothetical protein
MGIAWAELSTPLYLVVFFMLQMRGVEMVAAAVSCPCDLGVVGGCIAGGDDEVVLPLSRICVQSNGFVYVGNRAWAYIVGALITHI